MHATGSLEETLRRAAARTASFFYKCWGFGEAIAALGLLAAERVLGEGRVDSGYRAAVEELFARWWAKRGGQPIFEDHVTPGVPLLLLARDEPRWMEVAFAVARLYREFPTQRAVPVHRPDLGAWASQVWVDCLYTDGAFLALLARMTGEQSWEDLACEQALAYIGVLWDETSRLFFHSYDTRAARPNAIRRGRGNGWALLGLVDLLRFLRPDHPARGRLVAVVRRQVDALVALQHVGGHWHTILDRPDTYLEHPVAAMMAWAIPQAVRLGLVPESALVAALRAFEATLAATDAEGNLTGVSEGTPAGHVATYATRPTGIFPWGQGPLLLALADRLSPDRVWEGLP
ncbi:MAG: glycoside hydrolase family 88 protein [Armatimonadota bacterium]|nr:glycoside hydrolase family 88 protein [Armatimonadota bacterium]